VGEGERREGGKVYKVVDVSLMASNVFVARYKD
jgi:hypothetical protein